MTCIVPSPFADDHVHFLDGAGGGYALAAAGPQGPPRRPAHASGCCLMSVI